MTRKLFGKSILFHVPNVLFSICNSHAAANHLQPIVCGHCNIYPSHRHFSWPDSAKEIGNRYIVRIFCVQILANANCRYADSLWTHFQLCIKQFRKIFSLKPVQTHKRTLPYKFAHRFLAVRFDLFQKLKSIVCVAINHIDANRRIHMVLMAIGKLVFLSQMK